MGCSGCHVWMITFPWRYFLPDRPLTCAINWKLRSCALKSGKLNILSALKIPTTRTWSKSSPLVTICVPTRISVLRSAKSLIILWYAFFDLVESRSMRLMRAPGSRMDSSSSTFSVPNPCIFKWVLPQFSQDGGTWVEYPQ